MLTADLVKTIRKHRGPIYSALHGVDDLYWLQAVKADLLDLCRHIPDGELEADSRGGALYVSSAR